MALTLADLLTEFYARGFSDLNDSGAGTVRAKRWLNDAAHYIDGLADWPYLQSSTTGTPPFTISDVRTIESVTAVSLLQPLYPTTRAWLRSQVADLTTPGTPIYYYLLGYSLNVYPVATTTLTVDYWRLPNDLSSGTDEPAMPDRYRMAIVHYAVANAREDRGDYQGAQSARAQGDLVVGQMQLDLLALQHQGPDTFVPPVGEDT